LNDDFNYNFDEREKPLEDNGDNRDNFETYQKNAMDMKKHEEYQLEIVRIILYSIFLILNNCINILFILYFR